MQLGPLLYQNLQRSIWTVYRNGGVSSVTKTINVTLSPTDYLYLYQELQRLSPKPGNGLNYLTFNEIKANIEVSPLMPDGRIFIET